MVSFITSRQLKGLIENQRKDFQVVDLRREDFARDHIINAWHVPVTAQITKKQLNQLIKDLSDGFSDSEFVKVIFHCTGSKNRGPKVAVKFETYLQEEDITSKFESCILVGGFYAWETHCRESNLKLIASG
ncbi:CPA_1a_G0025650.mRNA.1.CDS.1 [Saccharomyces cerevisiae]|nr:CPI_1c_G0000870.mRNA.1.CDS.1 [Saccharomyces cerevisiae]CAI4243447.1 BBM_1a_G0000850.mRNA.1.CDS.1 [Saccharomyces cerevisiae]CAI4522044.1 CPA_1a_G0025650.mRNA.1.CDS.1 [Saccharomyces cerevisiae]CAI7036036.1 BBM_1a_G0000850.mRNA.1.CDS.1 [Saccharomyces cerevisiae]CAI7130324.1 CPI_1c_G0000870.mRNA.1.CDS.1 [Saccharomyces cerevisiae]